MTPFRNEGLLGTDKIPLHILVMIVAQTGEFCTDKIDDFCHGERNGPRSPGLNREALLLYGICIAVAIYLKRNRHRLTVCFQFFGNLEDAVDIFRTQRKDNCLIGIIFKLSSVTLTAASA